MTFISTTTLSTLFDEQRTTLLKILGESHHISGGINSQGEAARQLLIAIDHAKNTYALLNTRDFDKVDMAVQKKLTELVSLIHHLEKNEAASFAAIENKAEAWIKSIEAKTWEPKLFSIATKYLFPEEGTLSIYLNGKFVPSSFERYQPILNLRGQDLRPTHFSETQLLFKTKVADSAETQCVNEQAVLKIPYEKSLLWLVSPTITTYSYQLDLITLPIHPLKVTLFISDKQKELFPAIRCSQDYEVNSVSSEWKIMKPTTYRVMGCTILPHSIRGPVMTKCTELIHTNPIITKITPTYFETTLSVASTTSETNETLEYKLEYETINAELMPITRHHSFFLSWDNRYSINLPENEEIQKMAVDTFDGTHQESAFPSSQFTNPHHFPQISIEGTQISFRMLSPPALLTEGAETFVWKPTDDNNTIPFINLKNNPKKNEIRV